MTTPTLVLTSRSGKYTISCKDLQRYPDSLLASIASSGSSTNSSSTAANVINLDELPKSPFSSLPGAAAMIGPMYRDGAIPVAALDELMRASSGDVGTIHDNLVKLLAFLNLPGPLSKWMPSLHSLALRHARVLSLSYRCFAAEAVDLMLNYTPHAKYDSFAAGSAAFIVAPSAKPSVGEAAPPSPLSVYVFDAWEREAGKESRYLPFYDLMYKLDGLGSLSLKDTLSPDAPVELQVPGLLDIPLTKLPVVAEGTPGASTSSAFLSPTGTGISRLLSPVVTGHLLAALQAAARENSTSVGCVKASNGGNNPYGASAAAMNADLWVIRW